MSAEMALLLREEQSIFKLFNNYKKISGSCTAYASPDPEHPHWNLVYPSNMSHRYTLEELEAAEAFYASSEVGGHLLLTGTPWAKYSAETAEYFVADGVRAAFSGAPGVKEFSSAHTNDLADFCDIVGAAFAHSKATSEYFRGKMKILAASVPSRFWIIEFQGRRCGTASIFKTGLDSDFLFNFGVLPEFQNKNIGASMLRYVLSQAGRKVYTYSANPIMRANLLPAAGFRSLEITHAVPLERYKASIGLTPR